MLAHHRLLPSLASSLLLLLLGGHRVPLASADLLALQVNATNAPAGALDRAQQDADIYLNKLTSMEGSSYDAYAPGQAVPYSTSTTTSTTTTTTTDNNSVRMLRGGNGNGGDNDNEEAHIERRRLFDCPNTCSNSGSDRCRYLGCAYCGACRRLLLSDETSRQLWQNKQRRIEADLTSDLTAAYCANAAGCSIKAIIKRVNSDGSMSLAV